MVQSVFDMGQTSSAPKTRRKSLFSKGSSFKRNSLSHTFTWNDNDEIVEKLNINTATEEELMTLSGVNREIASSIVEHRKAIGRFRKVEDLAVVPGMGANKLENIKFEICVSKINSNATSSRAHSYDSLRSTESRLTTKSNKLVNINTASVFELQLVIGISQEVAASIVHYRIKRGNFRKIDQLLKVKGIDRMLLANISKYITTDTCQEVIPEKPPPSILTNGYTMPNQNAMSNGLACSSTIDIFDLVSAYSPRPVIKEDFKYSRKGEPAFRIASWNLDMFSLDKANNLGVKEVICRTILENGWSIVAVQDVIHVTALKAICEELNKPKINRVKEWKDKNHYWNFCMLDLKNSRLGFIYDADCAINIELLSLREGPAEIKSQCDILLATFRVGEINFEVINIMLNKNSDKQLFAEKFKEIIDDEEFSLTCIDFTSITSKSDDFLHINDLKPVVLPEVDTHLFYQRTESDDCLNVSNIYYNSKAQRQVTGYNGVIRQGLSHLAIPNGWNWGGPVSPFCPVWSELLVSFEDGIAL